MRLPTLYKKASTGKIQHWSIEATTWSSPGDPQWGVIRTRWGELDGKTQETEDVIKAGKNVGKKNETTAIQQANAEALAKWEKQIKKGYVQSLTDAHAGKVDSVIEGGVNPMLAHKFAEQGHKIKFPALAQPKFDGHRCIVVFENGKATLWSRTRKPITSVPHIVADVEKLMNLANIQNIILDGELYNHDYRSNFEELTSFIRQVEPKLGYEVVQYHIYDLAGGMSGDGIAVADLHQGARLRELNDIFNSSLTPEHRHFNGGHKYGSLHLVDTYPVNSADELNEIFAEFLERGYEGAMVRNVLGAYVNKRSYDLQKVKEFEDDEFEVVGVEEGRGKLAGHAVFVCEVNDDPRFISGGRFRCKLKGDQDALKQYVEDPSLALGRTLTVAFQGVTNKERVPRFPVGLRFKEEV